MLKHTAIGIMWSQENKFENQIWLGRIEKYQYLLYHDMKAFVVNICSVKNFMKYTFKLHNLNLISWHYIKFHVFFMKIMKFNVYVHYT